MKLEDIYKAKAKANQLRTSENIVSQISAEQKVDTKKELAKVAKVGYANIGKPY